MSIISLMIRSVSTSKTTCSKSTCTGKFSVSTRVPVEIIHKCISEYSQRIQHETTCTRDCHCELRYSSKVTSHSSLVAHSNSTRRVLEFHSSRTRIPLAAYSHSIRALLECNKAYIQKADLQLIYHETFYETKLFN